MQRPVLGVNRRHRLRFGARHALAVAIVAACVPLGVATAATVKADASAAAKDTLVVGVSALPVTLDSMFAPGQESVEIITNLLEPLYQYKKKPAAGGLRSADIGTGDKGLAGALAVKTDVSADGKTYTLHLRQGAKSAEGNEFTSADVKWIMDRAFGTKAVGAFVASIAHIAKPTDVVVVDKYTVRITLSTANPIFFRSLQLHPVAPYDSTAAKAHATKSDPWATDWMKRNAPGFGAYSVSEFTPGQQVVLKANPNYYGAKPAFGTVIYREIPDSSQRLSLLKQGQIDIAENLLARELKSLDGTKQKVVSVLANQLIFVALGTKSGPTANAFVRQALQYAVPVNDIVKTVFEGNAKPLRNLVPSGYPVFDPSGWTYALNLAKAKALLAKGGFASGFDIPLLVNADVPEHADAAVLLRDSFAKIGVKVSIDRRPSAAYLEQANSGKIGMVMHQGYSIVTDIPYHYKLYVSGPTGFLSFGGYTNPRFDQTIAKALDTPEGPARSVLVRAMQKIVQADLPTLSLVEVPTRYGVSASIKGYTWYPDNQILFADLSRIG